MFTEPKETREAIVDKNKHQVCGMYDIEKMVWLVYMDKCLTINNTLDTGCCENSLKT